MKSDSFNQAKKIHSEISKLQIDISISKTNIDFLKGCKEVSTYAYSEKTDDYGNMDREEITIKLDSFYLIIHLQQVIAEKEQIIKKLWEEFTLL